MSDNDDKRKFTRVNVDFQVSVSSGGKSPIEGTSRDISMGGYSSRPARACPLVPTAMPRSLSVAAPSR
jgi:hypothetical protein